MLKGGWVETKRRAPLSCNLGFTEGAPGEEDGAKPSSGTDVPLVGKGYKSDSGEDLKAPMTSS